MLITVILLSIVLLFSFLGNILLYRHGMKHLADSELLGQWLSEIQQDVNRTYNEIKNLDDKEVFAKDDEVGVVFKELVQIIEKFNERTQVEPQSESGE
jgi:hypothetical protein